jgi:NAD(P)-dependent dehydrogenase (short-subunit alcohol dehydrogenase family)
MEAGYRASLLDIERLTRGGSSRGVHEEHAAHSACRQSVGCCAPDIARSNNSDSGHSVDMPRKQVGSSKPTRCVSYCNGAMPTLDGKVALVTGGARGIGFATAKALIASGARVVISATSEGPATQAAKELGGSVVGVRADVRSDDDVARMFERVVSAFGGLDILVNNAGVGVFESVERTSLDQWRQVIDTNLTGVFLCTKHALPLLRSRGGGWIINISSLASTNPFADGATYCASKAGLNAFTESLMQEVRHDGIRVAAVLPGSVRTGFMGRSHSAAPGAPGPDDAWKLAPEDVAQAVVDLVGHTARSLPSRVEIRPARPPKRS